MEYLDLILMIIIIVLLVVLLFCNLNKKTGSNVSENDIKKIKDNMNDSLNLLSNSISNLVAEKNKNVSDELNNKIILMNQSIEQITKNQNKLNEDFNKFILDLSRTNNQFNEKLLINLKDSDEKLNKEFLEFKNITNKNNQSQKEEIMNKLTSDIKELNLTVKQSLEEFNKSLKEKMSEFKDNTNEALKGLNTNLDKNLEQIRKDNTEKLNQINETVNEKLQKTLEEKLKNSFESVVEGIGNVNKAVGEIKGIASEVGSLKSVLTNVKTKGIMGEVILGNIIKEFLTSGQYVENVATKKGSNDKVEFAIILPGTKDEHIYLPVDSKFPYEAYSIIHESGDIDEINKAKKLLRSNLLKYAKDVHDKYIDVPNTTDFAIIFLPLEGLYLEALNMGLFEEIQRNYKVNLTGPTTFSAFVNSLNMGFKSLLIEKKSADVFKLLGAVKNEFEKFTDVLEKTQKKVMTAADELEKLVGTRTRAINRTLKNIEILDDETTRTLIGNAVNEIED